MNGHDVIDYAEIRPILGEDILLLRPPARCRCMESRWWRRVQEAG